MHEYLATRANKTEKGVNRTSYLYMQMTGLLAFDILARVVFDQLDHVSVLQVLHVLVTEFDKI